MDAGSPSSALVGGSHTGPMPPFAVQATGATSAAAAAAAAATTVQAGPPLKRRAVNAVHEDSNISNNSSSSTSNNNNSNSSMQVDVDSGASARTKGGKVGAVIDKPKGARKPDTSVSGVVFTPGHGSSQQQQSVSGSNGGSASGSSHNFPVSKRVR